MRRFYTIALLHWALTGCCSTATIAPRPLVVRTSESGGDSPLCESPAECFASGLEVIRSAREQLRTEATSIMPPGSVVAWPGTAVPAGWAECAGQYATQSSCPMLYRTLGSRYGTRADGAFRLPDYRGMFLRGLNGERSAPQDPDPQRATDNGVGSVQGHALQQHDHDMATGGAGVRMNPGMYANFSPVTAPGNHGGIFTGGIGSGSAATETRPVNVAVKWIIRLDYGGSCTLVP